MMLKRMLIAHDKKQSIEVLDVMVTEMCKTLTKKNLMAWAFTFEKGVGLWMVSEPKIIDYICEGLHDVVPEDFDLEAFVKNNHSQPFWMADASKPLPNMCRWQK